MFQKLPKNHKTEKSFITQTMPHFKTPSEWLEYAIKTLENENKKLIQKNNQNSANDYITIPKINPDLKSKLKSVKKEEIENLFHIVFNLIDFLISPTILQYNNALKLLSELEEILEITQLQFYIDKTYLRHAELLLVMGFYTNVLDYLEKEPVSKSDYPKYALIKSTALIQSLHGWRDLDYSPDAYPYGKEALYLNLSKSLKKSMEIIKEIGPQINRFSLIPLRQKTTFLMDLRICQFLLMLKIGPQKDKFFQEIQDSMKSVSEKIKSLKNYSFSTIISISIVEGLISYRLGKIQKAFDIFYSCFKNTKPIYLNCPELLQLYFSILKCSLEIEKPSKEIYRNIITKADALIQIIGVSGDIIDSFNDLREDCEKVFANFPSNEDIKSYTKLMKTIANGWKSASAISDLLKQMKKGKYQPSGKESDRFGDINYQSELGYTALMIAVKQRKDQIVKVLIDAGANLNLMNNLGFTALSLSIEFKCDKIFQMLLKSGANPNIGHFPSILVAAQSKNIFFLKNLLSQKFDSVLKIDQTTKFDSKSTNFGISNALTEACKNQSLEMIQLLLEHNANPNGVKNLYTPPLFYCFQRIFKSNFSTKSTFLLLKHGANPNLKNKNGDFIFDLIFESIFRKASFLDSRSDVETIDCEDEEIQELQIGIANATKCVVFLVSYGAHSPGAAKAFVERYARLNEDYETCCPILNNTYNWDQHKRLFGNSRFVKTVIENLKNATHLGRMAWKIKENTNGQIDMDMNKRTTITFNNNEHNNSNKTNRKGKKNRTQIKKMSKSVLLLSNKTHEKKCLGKGSKAKLVDLHANLSELEREIELISEGYFDKGDDFDKNSEIIEKALMGLDFFSNELNITNKSLFRHFSSKHSLVLSSSVSNDICKNKDCNNLIDEQLDNSDDCFEVTERKRRELFKSLLMEEEQDSKNQSHNNSNNNNSSSKKKVKKRNMKTKNNNNHNNNNNNNNNSSRNNNNNKTKVKKVSSVDYIESSSSDDENDNDNENENNNINETKEKMIQIENKNIKNNNNSIENEAKIEKTIKNLNEKYIFFMFQYRTKLCGLGKQCSTYKCYFAHDLNEIRRKPFLIDSKKMIFNYSNEICTSEKCQNFIINKFCRKSHKHNRENEYHPNYYKTLYCKQKKTCIRGETCPFAHSKQEIRIASSLSTSENNENNAFSELKLYQKPQNPFYTSDYDIIYRYSHLELYYFFIYDFRTSMCTNSKCLNYFSMSWCPKAHTKSGLRRKPEPYYLKNENIWIWNYSPVHCSYKSIEDCLEGEKCFKSHQMQQESYFHPSKCKTELCHYNHYNGVCERYGCFCSRAGSKSEIRKPMRYPPSDIISQYLKTQQKKKVSKSKILSDLERKTNKTTSNIKDSSILTRSNSSTFKDAFVSRCISRDTIKQDDKVANELSVAELDRSNMAVSLEPKRENLFEVQTLNASVSLNQSDSAFSALPQSVIHFETQQMIESTKSKEEKRHVKKSGRRLVEGNPPQKKKTEFGNENNSLDYLESHCSFKLPSFLLPQNVLSSSDLKSPTTQVINMDSFERNVNSEILPREMEFTRPLEMNPKAEPFESFKPFNYSTVLRPENGEN